MQPRSSWSVARLMICVGALAVALGTLLSFRPAYVGRDPSIGLVVLILASILAIAVDQAFTYRRPRAFWIGFAATGWICSAAALFYLPRTRDLLVEHGPPIVGARREFVLQRFQERLDRQAGVVRVVPPVSELRLLCSMLAEVGLGLGVGILAASIGGVFAFGAAAMASRNAAADRSSSDVPRSSPV